MLIAEGEDLRTAPLKERRAMLAKIVRRFGLQKCEPVIEQGISAFKAVCELDLEGIVANRLADDYGPRTTWFKVLNPSYSQKVDRAELFERQASVSV